MNKLAAIVLAAGKGKRMRPPNGLKSKTINKVALLLSKKPMILYAVDLLESLKINPIIVVVGFAKESVIDILDSRVIFVEQKIRLGTAHAAKLALGKIDRNIKNVLVLNGDDSAFYTKDIVLKLMKIHVKKEAAITFLTIETRNPSGLGRVLRDDSGQILRIVEEKDATIMDKAIKEVNPACYIFSVEFLKKYLPRVEKSKITGEYYLTNLIDIAIKNKETVETVRAGKISWRGVNTIEELKEAEKLFL